jgi:lipid-A-disaccharide synthase-like uncharacterized protein
MNFLSHLYGNMVQHPQDLFWNSFGFLGALIFGVRFLIQWLQSEKAGHSVIPISFWYASFVGGMISFIYTIHQGAWPLLFQTALPLPIYARNIWMIQRDRGRQQA